MSSPIISVENLSKSYTISHQSGSNGKAGGYRRLSEELLSYPRQFISRFSSLASRNSTSEEFWALKDVSFEVNEGEVVGIIGRNGAGKSTLLKILSRITEPTSGRVTLRGRVASLLEVGTGFHPELTGRENVFLNGAILGMTRAEIKRKFDEIVDFAGVEKFLDTPVKRYSSGMYVRLAFAVAAHLDPEILIVDEVLAVGDAQFQKKCLGRMGEVAGQGRTVLIVTHNMGIVSNLCSKVLLLDGGERRIEGSPSETIAHYMDLGRNEFGEKSWLNANDAPGDGYLRLRTVRIESGGETTCEVPISRNIDIEIEFDILREGAVVSASIHLIDNMGTLVFISADYPSASLGSDPLRGKPRGTGLYRSRCTIPKNFLNVGRYSVNVVLLTDVHRIHAFVEEVVSFAVFETGETRNEHHDSWPGVVRPLLVWSTLQVQAKCPR